MARVLINHGWTNTRAHGHWQRWLNSELRRAGHQVQYPQYPETEHPKFDAWQELLVAELELLHEAGTDETIVISHSLAGVNFIAAAARGLIEKPLDRLLLVSPADPQTLDELPEFFQVDVAASAAAVHKVAKSVTVVASDKDPWLPRGVDVTFGQPLGVKPHIVAGGGHLTLIDGFGPWPGMLAWVKDPAADITAH
ncbi:MAG: hypothetical protein RL670_892 [Actinomycetota bacterium]